MMPVMMFFLFRGLSAGLVLYWTMFNVLSIIQTEIVHPRKPVTTS
jgi:membrane protein insertase Oxa1/YidC/SpoIIIJ